MMNIKYNKSRTLNSILNIKNININIDFKNNKSLILMHILIIIKVL